MSTYTQANRLMRVSTPLGPDALLLSGFMAHEAISQLFELKLDLLAENKTTIPFEKLLGASVTVSLNLLGDSTRHFNGIVSRLTQGERDETFTLYRAEVVPQLWLWTKKVQSRVFQHLSVPDILKQVLKGLKVTYQFQVNYHPRDYCVQYRESDFAFASRLMEEEGIYYFFQHEDGKHEMIVTDAPQRHPDVPVQKDVIYESLSGGTRTEMRVASWEKSQELRSGKYTLWDHCFELPDTHLEAVRPILSSAVAGKVTHELKVGGNDKLEIYDYPGGYAQRFDGVDSGGGAPASGAPEDLRGQPADGQDPDGTGNFRQPDNSRRGQLRALQPRAPVRSGTALRRGRTVFAHRRRTRRSPGRQFPKRRRRQSRLRESLHVHSGGVAVQAGSYDAQTDDLGDADSDRGRSARRGDLLRQVRPGEGAVSLGPRRQERCQQLVLDSGRSNLGRQELGAFFWPRIGHEVIVAFEEGDPDQPVIIGSVYNAANMPPFVMPQSSLLNGLKSSTARGQAHENYNGILFVDVHGHEHLAIHSERHMVFNSELDKLSHAGRHKTERVASASMHTVGCHPAGGGSGGSPTPVFKQPAPLGVCGLNSVMVFGQNLQVATPLNHQIAVGSNLQLCIDPLGLAAGVPSFPGDQVVTGFMGGGFGGNMQFTIGTSATVCLGREFDINFGPGKIELKPSAGDVPMQVFCYIIGGLGAAWPFVYALENDDTKCAKLSVVFQGAIDFLLLTLMAMVSTPEDGPGP